MEYKKASKNLEMDDLAENISCFRHKEVMDKLNDIEKREEETRRFYKKQLARYRKDDDTLLHMITKHYKDDDLVRKIIALCPSLLTEARTGDYKGQTAFHIAVSKKNIKAVKAMLENENEDTKTKLLSIRATGSRFRHTVMMGELPLSVAALTLKKKMVKLLLKNGAEISLRNSYDDTVFHSLVKYSACHPEKSEKVIKMMKILNKHLVRRKRERNGSLEEVDEESDPRAVWFYPNYEKLTPLLLASELGQNEIFDFILNLDDVYCTLQKNDGLFDIKQYDITEIDTVSLLHWFHDKHEEKTSSKNIQQDIYDDACVTTVSKNETRFNQLQVTEIEGALERICKLDTTTAIRFVKMPVIKEIIEKKWSKYWLCYYVWGLLHLLYMTGITAYTILRTEQGSISENNQTYSQNKKDFVSSFGCLNFIIPVIYLLMEVRCCYNGKRWNCMMHHNGTYRFLLLLFSVTTFVDAVWYLIQPGSAYLIIPSVLFGCWFLSFFLRAFKTFSFITMMLQALLCDLTRFSLFLSIEFLSFTVVIYMLFIPTNLQGKTDDNYKDFPMSMLSLFNVMLGLPELKVLTEASFPLLATLLQVLFIIITYVLMLNALIAIMSNTCSSVSSEQDTLWKVQTLSVILFIENILPLCIRRCSGEEKEVKYFDIKRTKMVADKRYILELDSYKPGYTKFSKAVEKEIEDNESKTNNKSRTPRENIDYEVSTIYI